MGCYIGDTPCNVLAFADALVSPTIAGIQKLINICEKYSIEFCVNFNPNKSKIVTFSNKKINQDINVYLNDIKIENSSEIKYLGFKITNKVNKFYNIDNEINDIKIRKNAINVNFNCLDTNSKILLFNSQCLELYGGFFVGHGSC